MRVQHLTPPSPNLFRQSRSDRAKCRVLRCARSCLIAPLFAIAAPSEMHLLLLVVVQVRLYLHDPRFPPAHEAPQHKLRKTPHHQRPHDAHETQRGAHHYLQSKAVERAAREKDSTDGCATPPTHLDSPPPEASHSSAVYLPTITPAILVSVADPVGANAS